MADPKNAAAAPVAKKSEPVPPPAAPSLSGLREKVAERLSRLLKSDSSKERAHIAVAILDLFNE